MAIVVGVLLLWVVPSVLHGPIASAFGLALKPVGLISLAVGVALLLLHYLLRRLATPAIAKDESTAAGPKIATQATRSISNEFGRHEPALAPDGLPDSQPAEPPQLRQRERQWSFVVLAGIEWRRFEAVCEAFYAQAGLATRSQSHGADGGVDIWLQSKHMDAPRIVQCKHWLGKPVGVKEMREFRGVMASHQLQSGSYVTSSTFTPDAIAFARANGISLQDGAALLRQISLRTPEQQEALLDVAYEGDYWRPTCASCGIKTVEKKRNRDGAAFWGCSNYPKCKTTFAMRL